VRLVIYGRLIAARYVQTKTGKIGQIDILQPGCDHYPSKVVSLNIPSSAMFKVLSNATKEGTKVALRCWLKEGREIEIDINEILSIEIPGGEDNRTAIEQDY
jgi:hypothetical protein